MNYKNLWLLPKYKEQVLSKNAKRMLILSQESKEMNWRLKDLYKHTIFLDTFQKCSYGP